MKRSRRLAVALALVALPGCASYPARQPASSAVHAAIFRYQREQQVSGAFTAIFLCVEEPPAWYAPKSEVFRMLSRWGIRASAYVKMKALPEAPPAEQLYLAVYARPERDYPDRVVVLGSCNSGDGSQGGTYRYFVEPVRGVWQVVRTEPVEFDTDCYGNFWFLCSSKRPS